MRQCFKKGVNSILLLFTGYIIFILILFSLFQAIASVPGSQIQKRRIEQIFLFVFLEGVNVIAIIFYL
jgi:hypothetical protein